MAEYKCTVCGYIYDTEKGESRRDVAAGTAWEDVPDDFRCPLCGAVKTMFKALYQAKKCDKKETKCLGSFFVQTCK